MNEVVSGIEDHIPGLRRYALSLTRNPVAADDLVQDCVVRALCKSRLYRPGTNLRAWLFTILHNLHASEGRRSGKWKRSSDPDAAATSRPVQASQTESVMLREVVRTMGRLPYEQRLVLYSVGLEGKSYEEVSEELGIPLGTVKSRCFRARKTLLNTMNGACAADGSSVAGAWL